MNSHYRPPRSGKRSLAVALIVPLLLASGAYVVLDHSRIILPAPVPPPDAAQRYTKGEADYAIPSPMPTTHAVLPVKPKPVAARALGPGVFKCEEPNGAITYSQYPCGQGTLVDTRPTSGGFAENWSITVKGR